MGMQPKQFKMYTRSCPMCNEGFESAVKPSKSLPSDALVCGKPACLTARNAKVIDQNDESIKNRRKPEPKQQTPLYGDMLTVARLNGLDQWGRPVKG